LCQARPESTVGAAGIDENGMDARLQKRVQRYGWDKAASHYERLWQVQLEPAQTALLEMAGPMPGERVLDVASGTGLVTLRAAALVGPQGEVVGVDISEEMIALARATDDAVSPKNVTFERMDAEQLAFDDGSFDVALCALGLMYAPDAGRALNEMRRVLRLGGRAACVVWGQRSRCGWAEIFSIVNVRVQSEVCPMVFRLGAAETLQDSFAAAGFNGITGKRLDTRLRYANGTEACEAAFTAGPAALAYTRFPEQTKAEAREEYLASLSAYRQGEGYSVPGEFVVVTGNK
jgi:ubiquinone/menaquinone biosynthesis C-methylase UbiE